MRVFIILILLILSTNCSSVNHKNYELNVSNLKSLISNSIFNQNSTIGISSVDTCKVEFKFQWSPEVSKRKGFHSVYTATIIDFANNYKSSRFVPSHNVLDKGIIQQKWSDLIEINFKKETEVQRVSLENENSEGYMTFYNTDYLSIGVANPMNMVQINALLKVFDSIHKSCS